MKIIFVSHSPILSGGAELALKELINHTREDHDVLVILPALGEFSAYLDRAGIKYKVIHYLWAMAVEKPPQPIAKNIPFENAVAVIEADQIINEFKPDFVFTNTMTVPWFNYAAKLNNVQNGMLISEIIAHDNTLELLPSRTTYFDYLNQSVNAVLFCSNFAKELYNQEVATTIRQDILPPISKTNLDFKAFDSIAIRPITKNKPINILSIGALTDNKNQKEIIQAIAHSNYKNQIHLTLVGQTDNIKTRNNLNKTINQNRLSKQVSFIDQSDDIPGLLADNQLYISSSKSESFGRTLAEASLAQTTIICTDSGGSKEIVTNETSALFYQSGDFKELAKRIDWLVEHPKKAEKLAKEAKKEVIKKFFQRDASTVFAKMLKDLNFKNNYQVSYAEYDYIKCLIQYGRAGKIQPNFRHRFFKGSKQLLKKTLTAAQYQSLKSSYHKLKSIIKK